ESRGFGFSDSDYGMNREIPNSNKTRRHYGSGVDNGKQRRDRLQSYGSDGDSIRNRDGLHKDRIQGQGGTQDEGQGRHDKNPPSGRNIQNRNHFDHGFYEGKTAGKNYFDGDDG